MKTLSGNLRRLQLSVALIALSFLCKALLYVTLTVGYSAGDPPYNSTITYPSYIDRHLCFPSYSNELRIVARTVWSSPLVIPLFTLFCDPFLTMYAALSFPTHHHPHRLNQSTNQLKSHTPLCILISFMDIPKPTASVSHSCVQITRCAGFRTTCRRAQRRSRAKVPRSTYHWRLLSHASRSNMTIFFWRFRGQRC